MEIASPGVSGKNGGRYGCTRTGEGCFGDITKKHHDGIDLKATPGTNVYSAFDGKVTEIRNSFSSGQYKKHSYGNYVVVESTIEGNKIHMKYNHLDNVSVTVGQIVSHGTIIGLAGTTGNAAHRDVREKHVHVQSYRYINNMRVSMNPEIYLTTKFGILGETINSPCKK
jgi:murein DD-endopeptidase MepM/ murein hydrolase activator NlpD